VGKHFILHKLFIVFNIPIILGYTASEFNDSHDFVSALASTEKPFIHIHPGVGAARATFRTSSHCEISVFDFKGVHQ
jgi:hypothetical protein